MNTVKIAKYISLFEPYQPLKKKWLMRLEERNILRNFNSVYTVLEFLSASNVRYQRHDVLLFFSLFKHILSLGGHNF